MTEPTAPRHRRWSARRLLAVGVVLLVFAVVTPWLNRKALVREALTGWLKGRGVASHVEVKAFGPTRFTAGLRIGPADNPILTVDEADVGYRLTIHGIVVDSVDLQRPALRAALHDGRLSVGSLDPLIREFLSRPPRPDAPKPKITIEGGRLSLATDYGALDLTADAAVEDGRLRRLTAVTAPARLAGPGFAAELGQASVNLVVRGDRADIRFDAPLKTAGAGDARMRQARLRLAVQAPYPDMARGRVDGAVAANASLAAASAEMDGRSVDRPAVTATFKGTAKGGLADLALAGVAAADLRTAGAQGPGMRAGAAHIALRAEDARWTRDGGDRASGQITLSAEAADAEASGLRIATAAATAKGAVSANRAGLRGDLAVTADGHAAWRGLGPARGDDAPSLAALKQAAAGFRFGAQDVRVSLADVGVTVALPRPARLTPDRGGRVELAGRGRSPVFGPDGGAFRLTASGGGLPRVEADVARFALAGDRLTARGHIKAGDLAFGVVRGGGIDAAGTLAMAGGRLTFTASDCAAFAAARLEFGANDARDVSGRFCPTGGPLASFAGGDWRAQGRAEGVAATIPFLQARATGGVARVSASGHGARPTADIAIETARIEDTAPKPRFNPLSLTGQANLTGDVWRADFDTALPGGLHVAHAHLAHDSLTGGGVEIETGELRFAAGGLQPGAISPLAQAVGSPAEGRVVFKGRFDWNAQEVTSSGRLEIPRLDFQSAAGRVENLSGVLDFSSLAPLEAAADQDLHIARLDAVVPVTDIDARFTVAGEMLRVAGGEATVGGGKVRVEKLDVPFDPTAAMTGVLLVDGVQLHDIVEASPFGDRVELDARVSGRLPFTATGDQVRVTGGELKAIAPGRLSIDRAAIMGVQAAGAMAAPGTGGPVSPNDTFTDFAYQAMEHLAFDTLEASIASRDDGRLGVLFHIVGKFDPPKHQEIRLPLMDLIRRKFLGRKLPLPSGTGVNLTLDTTLNLDDLLADYGDYRRLHGSGAVQPQRLSIGDEMTETTP
ncbi:MAG: C4-dicarboxylate ABC transporter [Phenylobacterium sp.]|uniref:intermembrane phospholipid transport protein YdbH family protein n=1 Tax=Phenylobacterium sp. TaxID=1871053 RepID=UPI0025F398DE|nr:YdbH domain-containing protein [Phenylobacterium sp.]MBI1199712.1 C4-dicarboxylate ABC transporter [Phenylobacterium sp.]